MILFAKRCVNSVRFLEKSFWLVSSTAPRSVTQNLDTAGSCKPHGSKRCRRLSEDLPEQYEDLTGKRESIAAT